jgi:alpha-ketoglutarate-dependent taurine dioxygenase
MLPCQRRATTPSAKEDTMAGIHETTSSASDGRRAGAGPYPFTLARLGEAAGAEITGVDLARPVDDTLRDAILDALIDHHVLAFRDQHLTKDQQYELTLRFGEIEGHVGRLPGGEKYPVVHTVTNLDENGNPTPTPHTHGNYFWHTDKSYHAVPSLATMLHAIEVPPVGGETEFANTAMAYAALPEETKRAIAGLRAVHSWEASRRNTGNKPATEEQKRERPPVSHPIVRTHPDTGERVLYIGIHTSHIEGMDEAEGRKLLAELLDHATQPRFVYSHAWRPGDLVMWDNRCLLHRAARNYDMGIHRRVLHRTVIRGTVPY